MNHTKKDKDKFESLRRTAEEILEKRGYADIDAESIELNQLIEELQIHQIELEHQNQELRATQNALYETKEKYRELYELAPVGYLTLKPDGTILEINRRGASMLGYEKSRLTGYGFQRLVSVQDRTKFHSHLQDAVQSHTRHTCELKLNLKFDKSIFVRLDSIRVDKASNSGHLVQTAASDITSEKEARERLRFKAQVLESAGEAVIASDLEGRLIYWSPAAERLYGWKKEEIMGKNIVDIHPAASSQKQARAIMDLVRQGKSWHGEFLVRDKQRREIPIFVTNTPYFDENGKISGVIGISRDISERKKMQSELVSAKLKAEEASRLKSMFLATMSHEIRTPLNAVIGFLDIVLSRKAPPDEQAEYLTKAKESSKFLSKLISNILDFSKIEAEQIEIKDKIFSLRDCINRIFSRTLMMVREQDKQIDLKKNISDHVSPEIVGDEFRLEQILTNLLQNAVKFTDQGEIELHIDLNRTEDETRLKFDVRDTGTGIPEDKHQAVFEPFVQASEESHIKYGGTGLGLAISKRLIEVMGGEIKIDSSEEKGTTVSFTLPYIPAEPAAEKPPQPVKPKRTSAERKGRILLVEDEKINQLAIKTILRKSGYSVLTADDGLKALELYRENPDIDAVLLDRRMPEMNGVETAKKLREIEAESNRKKIPVIALTASVQPEDREDMLSAGCDGFLSKPIEWKEILDCLDKYL